jgi:hypothetical protein
MSAALRPVLAIAKDVFSIGQRALEPADVDPSAELAAHLVEGAELAEPEPLVQPDRRVVRQRHPGVRAVHVLPRQQLEQRRVQGRPDSPTDQVRRAVDGCLHRGRVGRLGPVGAAGRVTRDGPRQLGDKQPVRACVGVVVEPDPTRLDRERLDVEGRVGVQHVVVVEVGQRR